MLESQWETYLFDTKLWSRHSQVFSNSMSWRIRMCNLHQKQSELANRNTTSIKNCRGSI